MSADNRICIMRDRWGNWCVWHGSGSMEYHVPPIDAEQHNTEKEAMAHALGMEAGIDILEYGVQVIGVDEQRVALEAEIRDLTERLELLNKTGSQFPPRV